MQAMQQKANREVSLRQTEQMGGSLRGTLTTVKLLQLLCQSTNPVPFDSINGANVGAPSVAEKV